MSNSKFIKLNIGINNNRIKKDPIGTYLITFFDRSIALDSNIIITNKNKTAIAPTYIITNNKAKNSHSKKNNNIEEFKKQLTKNNKEKTGWFDKITIRALNTKKKENTKNNILEFINN